MSGALDILQLTDTAFSHVPVTSFFVVTIQIYEGKPGTTWQQSC